MLYNFECITEAKSQDINTLVYIKILLSISTLYYLDFNNSNIFIIATCIYFFDKTKLLTKCYTCTTPKSSLSYTSTAKFNST
jgi:hypothetical protein